MRKYPVLIIETCLILGFLLIIGCILTLVFRPESQGAVITLITTVATVGVGVVIQLRATASNAAKLDQVTRQTNGINTTLLANLSALVAHYTGDTPIDTGQIDVIKQNVTEAAAKIDATKGLQ